MSEVVTFYSYKGGVGRTMALANVSVILSKWGHKVLVVDWDLEAPGLEHFYKNFIDIKTVKTTPGVIDLLQLNDTNKWQDCIIEINIPESTVPISFISSGKRDSDYFKKVRNFDVDKFYENDGGKIVEQFRTDWIENYDYILIDSRTGITEIGGICTIQLPDTIVMLFTATNQGFEGVLDIINRAGAAQQKLPYSRQKLVFLPIPSKFETNEFKLSQEWLEIFAEKLQKTYDDWLPISVNKKVFLELTKIPYIPYFSFGEKLPVIEQGVKDATGLGYAYETLAVILAHRLSYVDWLFNNRDLYVAEVNKYNPILKDIAAKDFLKERIRKSQFLFESEANEYNSKIEGIAAEDVLKDRILRDQFLSDVNKYNSRLEDSTLEQGNLKNNVFVSYSHRDLAHFNELKRHFSPYEKSFKIWFDREGIKIGDLWKQPIEKALDEAEIAVLLLSPDFFASEFIRNYEIPQILRREKEGLKIIIIVISPCDTSIFKEYQFLNSVHKPVISMKRVKREELWLTLLDRVMHILNYR